MMETDSCQKKGEEAGKMVALLVVDKEQRVGEERNT